jgi:peptide/nickel transport system substrate-binding protein
MAVSDAHTRGRRRTVTQRRQRPSARAWRSRWCLALVLVAGCLGLTACGGSSSSSSSSGGGASAGSSTSSAAASGPAHAGGSLTVLESAGFAGDWPTGLDPATNTNGAADQSYMDSIYGQLFELTSGGKLVPDLATGYKFKNGGKTVEIALRPGVKFTDGTPLNAQAVVFNIKRDLASACTCKPTWPVSSVTAAGPQTVAINLKAPDGALIHQLQDSNADWIASPTALKKMGEQQFKLKPVGAGPFTVVSDKLSSVLVLKKNPGYWKKGRPYLDQLTFKTTAGDESALEAMQSGAAQAYEGMASTELVKSFKSHFNVTAEPSTSPYNIQLNTAIPPFNNIKARQAIYYATDAKTIDQKLFGDVYPVVQSFTAPAGLFYSANVPGYPSYDLAKAKALVKSLGGLTVNLFTIQQPANQNFMVALQQLWKQAGINASIHLYPLSGLIQQFQTKKWQAALQTAGAWDPAGGVGVAFRFSSLSPFSGVHDPKLDGMLNAGQAAIKPSTRAAMYAQAGAYIAKQAYSPFLFPVATWNIAKQGVQGPGLTTQIPSVAVNPQVLWEEASTG